MTPANNQTQIDACACMETLLKEKIYVIDCFYTMSNIDSA
jgi:hypothetical protein